MHLYRHALINCLGNDAVAGILFVDCMMVQEEIVWALYVGGVDFIFYLI